jgi:mannose/cellobiose epimerase-like protein (N-acyl-D-glucosamine 2-epimerase family)
VVLGTAGHRAELDAECRRVLRFAAASRHPDGGFGWLDERGRLEPGRPVAAYVTARMTHVFAIGTVLGLPGQDELVAHGVAALRDLLRDREFGGWYGAVRPTDPAKKAYEHAFVVLAASSAAVVGAGDTLLADALDVQQRHFWRDDDGVVVEEWDRRWRTLDPYRGANANMHTVEAYLAAADAGADPVWRERALRITERIVHRVARPAGWLLPSITTRAGRRCRSSTGTARPTSSARTG